MFGRSTFYLGYEQNMWTPEWLSTVKKGNCFGDAGRRFSLRFSAILVSILRGWRGKTLVFGSFDGLACMEDAFSLRAAWNLETATGFSYYMYFKAVLFRWSVGTAVSLFEVRNKGFSWIDMKTLLLVFGIVSAAGLWWDMYVMAFFFWRGVDFFFVFFLIKTNFENLPLPRTRWFVSIPENTLDFIFSSSASYSISVPFLPLPSEHSPHEVACQFL